MCEWRVVTDVAGTVVCGLSYTVCMLNSTDSELNQNDKWTTRLQTKRVKQD